MNSAIDGYLKSPFSGIVPWIVMAVLNSPGRFEEAVCFALALSLLTIWGTRRCGRSIYPLDIFGVAYFVVLAAIGLVASDGVIGWMETWAGETTTAALALFVTVTLIAGRPFTLPYAKAQTPKDYWQSPLFVHVNTVLSGTWAATFAISAAVGAYGNAVLHDHKDFWTSWVIPAAVVFFAIAFSGYYPDYAGAKDAAARGEHETPPALASLFAWVPHFVLIVGIFGWVTDALPDALGIVLIVVGIVGGVLLDKLTPTASKHEATAHT